MSNEMQNATTQDTFSALLKQATVGEKVIAPLVGKHEGAILQDVQAVYADTYTAIVMTWGGLLDRDGYEQTHQDREFLPNEDTHPIGKGRFMRKMKSLEIFPDNQQEILYFTTPEAVDTLVAALATKIGEQFPLTIAEDNRGFLTTTVRKRPKPKQPF